MTHRQDIRERRRKKKQQQRVTTILILVGFVFIIAAVLMMPTIRDAVTPVGEFNQPSLNPRPMAKSNTMGDPNAPVKIQIYSDFGCGHCAIYSQTTGEQLVAQYVTNGQVFFEFNSVGGLLNNPNSLVTAEAAYCAGEQEMFWEYHDILYANQTALFANMNKKLDKTLIAYADSLGMNTNAFKSCIGSNRFNSELQQDQIEATQAGINSTPSFLINGTLVVGNQPLEQFQTIIEAELAQASQ
jgi:protein-disulfide isomerase